MSMTRRFAPSTIPVAISSSADLNAFKSWTDSSVKGNDLSALPNLENVPRSSSRSWGLIVESWTSSTSVRAAVSAAEIETLLQNRAELGPQILQTCQQAAQQLGLKLDRVAIRDLTLPGDLKKIFAQVVKARQEGLAALERARGETAALRNLANAAQMLQRNPQLFQLRLLQVAGQQTGTTLIVGMPQGSAPIPVPGRGAELGELPPESPPDSTGE